MNEQERQLLLAIADDELVLGWRDSEWTGIAPMLEEDVAFSSIAQNEIGHARAIYQLLSRRCRTRSRSTARRRSICCAPLVELRFVPDWARTIARRVLYEAADELRLAAAEGIAERVGRRPRGEDRPRGGLPPDACRDVARAPTRRARASARPWTSSGPTHSPWPIRTTEQALSALFKLKPQVTVCYKAERGSHAEDWLALWDEMTRCGDRCRARHGDRRAPSGRRSARSRIRRSR